jgi:uncharacterized protein YbjT (DUF2867 family)
MEAKSVQVIVLGAAGQLGREVVQALAARGHSVCAAVRRPPDSPSDNSVLVRQVDAQDKAQVRAAITGFDVVVNVIGGGTLRRNDVESTATTVATAAAQDVGVQRYIAMSAAMVAVDWRFFRYVLRPLIFKHILEEHRRVEKIVSATALRWTIVRPPKLTNGAARGYLASLEFVPTWFSAARGDVAAFIADEVENNAYVRRAVFVASSSARRDVARVGGLL